MKTFSGLFIVLVRMYRWFLAPLFISLGVQCRFHPSCSEYALGALKIHGPWRGSLLTGARLLRCHPFCKGGHDPVPPLTQWRRING